MSKRKSHDDPGSQRTKVARPGSSKYLDNMRSCDRPWPLKAGMIEEVNLKNFMCHEKFRFLPNTRLNFLVGVNGSGKSAILTAIIFALGGNAKMANRGSSNKGFIKTGQTSATVEVKMANVGDLEFKEHLYGKSIIVSRTVTETSSTYKLKDENGKIVVSKRVREELQKILNQFNIQIENPMIVLNQDASKTFLSKVDPDLMYKFFHKSTQLKKVEDDYAAATEILATCKDTLERKNDSMPTIAEEAIKWHKKLELLDSLKGEQSEMFKLQTELSWAIVRDNEKTLQDREKNKDVEMQKTQMCEEKVVSIKATDKEMRARKISSEKEIQRLAGIIDDVYHDIDKTKKHLSEKHRKTGSATREINEIEMKIKKAARNMKDIQNGIKDAKKNEQDYEEKRLARQQQMEQLQQECQAIRAQMDSSNNHLDHLKNNLEAIDHQLSAIRYEGNGVQVKIQGVKDELQQLQSGEKNKLATFGPWMPRLVAEINRYASKFSKLPIGPLGAHITVRDGVPDDVVTILETELSGLLNAFCCNTNNDQVILFDIFNKLKISRKPLIITSEFAQHPHNINEARVMSKFTALIDCIETADPNVFNAIIDNAGLEKIVVISNQKEAQKLLSNVATVPANLKYAVVAGKYQYYPAPNYKSYFKDYKPRNVLKASIEDYIQERKNYHDQLKEEKKVHDDATKQNQVKFNETKKLVQQEENKIRTIRNRETEKNIKIQELKTADNSERPVDIAALADDEAKYTHELETLEAKKIETAEKHSAALAEEQEITDKVKALEADYNKKYSDLEPLKRDLTKCEEGIKKNKRDMDHYSAKKKEHLDKANSFNDAINEARTELEKNSSTAAKIHGDRVESRRETAKLKQELTVLKTKLDKLTGTVEPKEVVAENYNKFAKAYKEAQFELQVLCDMIKEMGGSLHVRKKNYSMMLRSTSQTVQRNFTLQLQTRGFLGILEFNHKTFTLVIKVNPQDKGNAGLDVDRDLKTLSGGEKSFTLISFILSLWNVMYPPFRILDEFDVFMDSVNRRIAINNIIHFAREDRKNQFIFLTPLNTDNIEVDEDLKIIQLQKLK